MDGFVMMCESQQKDLYAVLGASPADSPQQLRRRYQQLALKYHPDRLGDEQSSEFGVERFLEVDAAWKVLSDPSSRTQYDALRRAQELKQDWTVDATVHLEDMTWETDECEYSYCCRCGGTFRLSKEEVEEEETQRRLAARNEEETQTAAPGGVMVCCDSCSLCIHVACWLDDTMQTSK